MDGKHVHIQVKIEAFARSKAIQVTETCDEFPVLVWVTGAPWHRADEMLFMSADIVLVFNVRMFYMKKLMMTLVDMIDSNDRLSILFWGFSGIEHVMELTYMSDHGRNIARLKINELFKREAHVKEMYNGPILPEAAQVHPTHSSMM
jgi:hypothetical protein